jgi:hypothetical protein
MLLKECTGVERASELQHCYKLLSDGCTAAVVDAVAASQMTCWKIVST